MKKILLVLTILFSLGSLATEPVPTSIKFEEGNFFAITQQFNGRLLDNFAEKVLSYKGEELVIYFDTPGGSVIALSSMARIMKGSNIKFTCVASFAASAGFMLFQHCDNRLLLAEGILMSHNWSGGFRGEAPRIISLFNAIQSLIDTLEGVAVDKMSVEKEEYAALINSNLWMPVPLALKYDAIDGVLSDVSCASNLMNQRIPVNVRVGYTNYTRYKSGCPLIQKLYRKIRNNNNTDTYLKTDESLFSISQLNYVPEEANWIYMGKKRN